MRDGLAEQLLAKVMGWSAADVARERPILQLLAELKYDEYQQYAPGLRFVESLALWLNQFDESDRNRAYHFVKDRLVFFSSAEVNHFSKYLYPHMIRRLFLERAADHLDLPRYRVHDAASSETFGEIERSALFFGLSDGARMDIFRRANAQLSHEQIFRHHELNDPRLKEISKRVDRLSYLVLIDDFSASGASYFRTDDQGEYKGKVAKFLSRIRQHEHWKSLVDFSYTRVVIALYIATESASRRIDRGAKEMLSQEGGNVSVLTVQTIPERLQVTDDEFSSLANSYYDPSCEDRHMEVGGTSTYKWGFAACRLPVVLHHNSPNNSIYLLWAPEEAPTRGLFPRVSRHRETKQS